MKEWSVIKSIMSCIYVYLDYELLWIQTKFQKSSLYDSELTPNWYNYAQFCMFKFYILFLEHKLQNKR